MKRRIAISANVPDDATDEEIAYFIMEALEIWGGQRRPDDVLFHSLEVKSVKIRNIVYVNED